MEYRNQQSKKSKLPYLLVIVLILSYQFYFKDRLFGDEDVLNKNFVDYTYNDWKLLADQKAQGFYECAKGLDYSTNNYYESCARYYRNDWVSYRDALDNKANLSYDKIKELKNYWQSKSDEIVEKVSTAIDKNEKNRRPNKY